MRSSKLLLQTILIGLGLAFLLSGCIGTEPRKLSTGSSGSRTPPEDTTDKFILELAYRDTLTGGALNRTIAIQGRASSQANLFVNICGADASKCACSFFKGSDTSTAFPALTKSVNQEINVMTCQVPAGILDAELGTLFVRITDSSGTKNSGLMRVKSQLVLADILGELPQGQIRKVFGYTCARTFLEGSGISGTSIDCNTAGMQLGFLGADYQFYLFQQVDLTVNNFNERGNELSYNGDAATGLTCGLLIKKYSCSNTNVLKFGLAAAATAKFRIGITFTSGPEPLGRQGFYGFAAPTDSNLNCPPGLVKIRPFQAVPSTYTAVASNFVNSDGRLNDNRVEVASSTVANFELRRRAPSAACVAGVCPAPSAGTSVVQSIPYSSLNPFLCAIPQELITDI